MRVWAKQVGIFSIFQQRLLSCLAHTIEHAIALPIEDCRRGVFFEEGIIAIFYQSLFWVTLFPCGKQMIGSETESPNSKEQPIMSGEEEMIFPVPFPEYLVCPNCGEPEVEIWCNEKGGTCHACGKWISHEIPRNCKSTGELRPEAD